MNVNPSVSIIIPCYNYGHYLSEALESLIKQIYSDWECLIIDDGSTDNTKFIGGIYSENDKRIRYFYQKNHGLSSARNLGLRLAKGDFIQFLDADDMIEPGKIKVQVEYLESHPEVDIVYGETLFFEDNKSKKNNKKIKYSSKCYPNRTSGSGEVLVLSFLKGNFITVNSALIRSSLIDDIGYFNESLSAFEDWEFWLRSAIGNKFFQFLEPKRKNYDYCLVREHPSSMSKDRSLMIRSGLSLRRSLDLSGYGKTISLLNQDKLIRLEAILGIELVRTGHVKDGLLQYFSALRQSRSRGIIILDLSRLFLSEKCIESIKLRFI